MREINNTTKLRMDEDIFNESCDCAAKVQADVVLSAEFKGVCEHISVWNMSAHTHCKWNVDMREHYMD